jgi:hypothetical protein
MNKKHTPGPWIISDNRYVQEDAHGGIIARVDGKNLHANIRLIAAAPDLLEALQRFAQCSNVRDIVQGDTELALAVFQARAAIAKAIGKE